MRKTHVPDDTRMPVISNLYRPNKLCGLALTLCLASTLANVAFADNHVERTVKAVGTLSAIVNKNYIDAGVSKNQIMVAILAANPSAFKGGNINNMLGGVDLRLPPVEMIKNISQRDANNLLKQHYAFFRQGKTGNLPPPTFITITSPEKVQQLVEEKEEQSEKLDSLQNERERLNALVQRLEDEKAKRDRDLEALEDKIQSLQSSSNALGSSTADLKLKLANGELTGEGAKVLEELQERNQSLNAQLQAARSEMAESTRMEISLERRIGDIQNENARMSDALKQQGIAPEVIKAGAPVESAVTQTAPVAAPATTAPVATTQSNNSGFNTNWLYLLIPVIALFAIGWLAWLLFQRAKDKKQNQRRRQQAPVAASSLFVNDGRMIDPAAEVEQEPPLEVSIKLDVARAYVEAGDLPSAHEMLNEVMDEGNTQQQLEAQKILEEIEAANNN
jgi:FimV-like protein